MRTRRRADPKERAALHVPNSLSSQIRSVFYSAAIAVVFGCLAGCGDPTPPAAKSSAAESSAAESSAAESSAAEPSAADPAADPAPISDPARTAPRDEGPGPLSIRMVWQVVDQTGASIADSACFSDRSPAPHPGSAPGSFFLDLPIPADGDLSIRISAPGFQDTTLRPTYIRPGANGDIDLGPVVLRAGRTVRIRVTGVDGPINQAEVHLATDGAPFPPRAPGVSHRVVTRLDEPPLARTDADGIVALGLPPGRVGVFVRAEDRGIAHQWIEADEVDPIIRIVDDHSLHVRIETDTPDRLPNGEVELIADFGGLRVPYVVPEGEITAIPLDQDRPIAVRIDARGFEGISEVIPEGTSTQSEPHIIRLKSLPLGAAKFEARDSVTKQDLPVTGLRIGRARDNEPDRLDFVPDWNTVVQVDNGRAKAAAAPGRHDVMIQADGYLETLARRIAVDGSEQDPNTVQIDLQPGPAIAGKIIRDPEQTPIASAAVIVRRVSRDLIDLPLLWRLGGTVGLVDAYRTGEDGAFSIQSSAWEEIAVEVYGVGQITRPRRFPRNATGGLRIAVPPVFSHSGTLANVPTDTERLAVYLFDPARAWRFRADVQPDGSFTFDGVQPGQYLLYLDYDDRSFFHGRLGGLDHTLVREMHGAPRGVPVQITHNGTELPSPPDEPRTARPVQCSVTIGEGDAVHRIMAVRKDRQLAASRLTVADAVGRHEVNLPPVGEGPLILIALDANGKPLSVESVEATWPHTRAKIDPRLGILSVMPGNHAVDHLVATHTEIDGSIARTAGLAAWSPVVLEKSDTGHFQAELAAGSWLIQARDEEADVIEEATVIVPPGGVGTHSIGGD